MEDTALFPKTDHIQIRTPFIPYLFFHPTPLPPTSLLPSEDLILHSSQYVSYMIFFYRDLISWHRSMSIRVTTQVLLCFIRPTHIRGSDLITYTIVSTALSP